MAHNRGIKETMWSYVARRLLFVVPTLLGVSIIMFSLLHVVPGDPLAGLLPLQSGPAEREQLARELGLDKPVFVQYGKWLGKAVQGDLGRSLTTNRPIGEQVIFALRNTFILAITAGVLSMVMGVILGHHSRLSPRALAGQGGQRPGHYGAQSAQLLGGYHTYHHIFRRIGGIAVPGHELP